MAGNSPNDLRQEREPANMFSKLTLNVFPALHSLNSRNAASCLESQRLTNGFMGEASSIAHPDFVPIVYVEPR